MEILLPACGVVGVVVTALGSLDSPPRRCWGGTVTVIGAVMTGAVRGMGSDTEMTTLLGAALDPEAAGFWFMTTCWG